MGLFGFDLVKEAGGWEAAMTEEEITEMEKKGYDMSSVRGRQTEMAAQEEAARPPLWNGGKQLPSLRI